jgi:hypothetical protein
MTKRSGLGDSTELSQMGLSQALPRAVPRAEADEVADRVAVACGPVVLGGKLETAPLSGLMECSACGGRLPDWQRTS